MAKNKQRPWGVPELEGDSAERRRRAAKLHSYAHARSVVPFFLLFFTHRLHEPVAAAAAAHFDEDLVVLAHTHEVCSHV